jgi:hypothetical protein
MKAFDHILNWKLKPGSHKFPGPDGGTCINEAALVAAGFDYRPIADVRQMPPCFSRPICRLAMRLNDSARDGERQFLLPFVTRLACADRWEIERKRAAYIESRMPKGRLAIRRGIEILEGALAIGRQAGSPAPHVAGARMDAVRAKAAASRPRQPLSSKFKAWMAAEKVAEPAG